MIKDFFGFGTGEYDYGRPADGAMSWQHLVFVSAFILITVALAIVLGVRNRGKSDQLKNRVLIWSAVLIDSFEIAKIIIGSIHTHDFWKISLPLFLCSIQLITIPLAAFCKGKLKEAALDFVSIFGLLGGILGTFGATQNYNTYPVLSWPNFVSSVTHCISAFAALYILISGMASMKKKNIPITFGILFGFGILAHIANTLLDYNYMFLVRSDGTPYEILYQLVNGDPVLYPLTVMLLFVIYIILFNVIFNVVKNKKAKKADAQLKEEHKIATAK